MSPGWKKSWHIGIRVGETLCAFISAVPINIRVRKNTLPMPEVNFLCIHKKLRGKRLAPVLIKEVTRRVNLESIWQAIYTGGIVLPKPVSTCRYFHRALNWMKLYEVGFSPLPPNSKPQFQVRKYKVPENTTTQGLREMQKKDLDAVHILLERYLKRFDLAPVFSREETEHYLLPGKDVTAEEQVIWSYVVEVRCSLYPTHVRRNNTNPSLLEPRWQNHRLLFLLLARIICHPVSQAQVHPRSLSLLLRHRGRPDHTRGYVRPQDALERTHG